mgnify:CR=1
MSRFPIVILVSLRFFLKIHVGRFKYMVVIIERILSPMCALDSIIANGIITISTFYSPINGFVSTSHILIFLKGIFSLSSKLQSCEALGVFVHIEHKCRRKNYKNNGEQKSECLDFVHYHILQIEL